MRNVSCSVTTMTLGHNIVQRDFQFNPEESEVNFRDIFNSITSAFYGDYTFRLELAGHRHPPVDRYIEHFGEFTPSSFVVDQRARPVFRPGYDKLCLVFVVPTQNPGAGRGLTYVARYLVFAADAVSLYGNGPRGLRVNTNDGRYNVAGVVLKQEHLERVVQSGAVVL